MTFFILDPRVFDSNLRIRFTELDETVTDLSVLTHLLNQKFVVVLHFLYDALYLLAGLVCLLAVLYPQPVGE